METTISKNTMFCSSCGNEISKSARFCTHCGAASGSHTAGNANVNESSSGQTVQSKIYDISSEDSENLIDKTEYWLNSENQFEVQRIKNLTTTVLQIRKKGNS